MFLTEAETSFDINLWVSKTCEAPSQPQGMFAFKVAVLFETGKFHYRYIHYVFEHYVSMFCLMCSISVPFTVLCARLWYLFVFIFFYNINKIGDAVSMFGLFCCWFTQCSQIYNIFVMFQQLLLECPECMCVCVCVCVCVRVCIFTYTHIYIYIYITMHTHRSKGPL